MKILHIITSLNFGGAENTLFRLISKDNKNIHIIIVLTSGGYFYKKLIKQNKIYDLKLKKINIFSYLNVFYIFKVFYYEKPDVVQTWMYHSDLIGGIFAKIFGIKKIFWNVRNSNLNKKWSNLITLMVFKINAFLSSFIPNKIICCSQKAINFHVNNGYIKKKFFLIHNGFDYKNFSFNIKKIDKRTNSFVVIARWDPQKDHQTLLNSFYILNRKCKEWKLYMYGKNINYQNIKLLKILKEKNLLKKVFLKNITKKVDIVFKKFDYSVLSSAGNEGFPNVVAESMLSGTPVIATDSGDTKLIINKFGWTSSVRNSKKLSKNLYKAIKYKKNHLNYLKLRKNCRDLIIKKFSINKMIENYNFIWTNN